MQINSTLIKNMSLEDRPREKLELMGTSSLTNSELLAILISTGTRNRSAVDLSKDLLQLGDGSINELARKNVKELTKVHGIGKAKALTLSAAFELGKRRKIESIKNSPLTGSDMVFKYVQPIVQDCVTEEFWAVALSKANNVIDKAKISSGGVAGTVVDVKCLLKFCIENLASNAIVFHNHPSGNIQPSEADKNITVKIQKALKLCDIHLLDHLITGQNEYYSFADEGRL